MLMRSFVILLLVGCLVVSVPITGRACNDYADYLRVVGTVSWWGGDSEDIVVAGNYAYVACDYYGIRTIDVGDPENPVVTSYIDSLNAAFGIGLKGNYLFVAAQAFWVLDLTMPDSPVVVTSLPLPAGSYGMEIDGDYVYLACGDSGLQVIDVSNPATPTIVGAQDTPGKTRDIALDGNYAYLADELYMQVVDVTDPTMPAIAGAAIVGYLRGIDVSGGYACCALGDQYMYMEYSGLYILDVTVPSAPVFEGGYDYLSHAARRVVVDGNYALMSVGWSDVGWNIAGEPVRLEFEGLNVMDISVPSSPTLVNGIEAWGASGLAVTDDYVFLGFENGMMILNGRCNTATAIGDLVPEQIHLRSFPNPFNPSTLISFNLPVGGAIHLAVYNTAGEGVRTLLDEVRPLGKHAVTWNGTDSSGSRVASGVYYAALDVAGVRSVCKLVLLK